MKNLIYILILGFCYSCSNVGVTELEEKAVESVLDFYGGICNRSKGFNSENGNTKTYFELKMSQSDVLEENAHRIEMPASNIAYLFYKNLNEEKSNYDDIHSVITFKDGTEKTFKYSTDLLELVNSRMTLANKAVDLLTNKDYDNLKQLLNNELASYDKDELISNLIKFEPQFGDIKEFRPFGFRVNKLENGRDILHISGALIREVQNSEFSLDIDLNSEKEEIYLLQYKL
jgi:hypothetical protein